MLRDLFALLSDEHFFFFSFGRSGPGTQGCHALLERLRNHDGGSCNPQCVVGWWDEQLLAEWGLPQGAPRRWVRGAREACRGIHLLNAVDQADIGLAGQPASSALGAWTCALLHESSARC